MKKIPFKYFKGETKNPFDASSTKAMWWEGERALSQQCAADAECFDRLVARLKFAIANKSVSGLLLDQSLSIEQRAIVFYLDLWHGRFYPYDNLDIISTY
jgi:hypothetical protein